MTANLELMLCPDNAYEGATLSLQGTWFCETSGFANFFRKVSAVLHMVLPMALPGCCPQKSAGLRAWAGGRSAAPACQRVPRCSHLPAQ